MNTTTVTKNENIFTSIQKKLAEGVRKYRKNLILQLMILPGVIYFLIFNYIPMYGVLIAFQDFNMKLGIFNSKWIGLENFIRFFHYPSVWNLISNTIILNVYNLLFTFPLPILLALMLNEVNCAVYKKFVQTISYLPHFISTVAICGMITLVLSPQGGMINNILAVFNIDPIYFLAKKEFFRTIYVTSEAWQTIGWSAIIYIAALTSVPTELYEAATIDGATRIQKMYKISIPTIAPTIIILLILNLGKLMNSSADKALLLQMPVTYDVSDVIGTYIYRRGLIYAEYSYSTAVGLFNSVINLILVLVVNKISKTYSETSLF